jgi:hypothetical protein
MKVTLTELGLQLRRELLTSRGEETSELLERQWRGPSRLKKPTFETGLLVSMDEGLQTAREPKQTAHAEVNVRIPKIHISKEFQQKYARQLRDRSALQRSPKSRISGLLSPATAVPENQSLDSGLQYLERKFQSAYRTARTIEDKSKMELRYRKLQAFRRYEMQKQATIYESIRMRSQKLAETHSNKVEKLRHDLDQLAQQHFVDKFKGVRDTHRLKAHLQELHHERYDQHWRTSRVMMLASPRRTKRKYLELKSAMQ